MRLSLVEVEVLETSGLLLRPCATCELATPWGYAEKPVAMAGPPEEAAMVADAQAEARAAARGGIDQRKHRRVSLLLPISIRDYYGGVEITKTENVSKSGFCFVSEKEYHIGSGILVVCPYNPSGQNIEVRARIVRQTLVEGTNRKVYGVRYETPAA